MGLLHWPINFLLTFNLPFSDLIVQYTLKGHSRLVTDMDWCQC
jgi:hypothetical protein